MINIDRQEKIVIFVDRKEHNDIHKETPHWDTDITVPKQQNTFPPPHAYRVYILRDTQASNVVT